VPSFPPPPWLPPGGGGEVVAGCKEGISRRGMIRATSPAATSPPPIFSGFATQFSSFVEPESHPLGYAARISASKTIADPAYCCRNARIPRDIVLTRASGTLLPSSPFASPRREPLIRNQGFDSDGQYNAVNRHLSKYSDLKQFHANSVQPRISSLQVLCE